MQAEGCMVALLTEIEKDEQLDQLCFPVRDAVKKDIIPEGISCDLTPEEQRHCGEELLQACRRTRVNCGHPSNEDLSRTVRLGGGSELAWKAIKKMRCTMCAAGQSALCPARKDTKERCAIQ